jgi:hypothetical protein
MSTVRTVSVDDDGEITELTDLDIQKMSAVTDPAHKSNWLVMKGAADAASTNHNYSTLDGLVDGVVKLAEEGVTKQRLTFNSLDDAKYALQKLKAHGLDFDADSVVVKALGDPPAKGSSYDGADRCSEADKFSTECFADPIVVSKLSKADQEFVKKARAAIADPKVNSHVKEMMQKQLENVAYLCNNGGAVTPDPNAVPQIGATGTLKKGGHLSPRQLTARLDAAIKTASPAQIHLLAMMRPQIEEFEERVTKTVVNKTRVAKGEILKYDESNARTAAMIAQTIENITRTSATLTDPSGSTSPGVSGAAGNVGSVRAGPSVGGVSGVAGVRTSTTGAADVELPKAEKALADATTQTAAQAAGEAATYWRLVKMRGG